MKVHWFEVVANGALTIRDAFEQCRDKTRWPGVRSFGTVSSYQSSVCSDKESRTMGYPLLKICLSVLLASVYVCCIVGDEENDDHMFIKYRYAVNLWFWLSDMMNVNFNSFTSTQ